jgi:hypothetical protein
VGSLPLRPGDSLTNPKLALSMGFRPLVSLQSAIQATGPLAITLAGLTPAEDASLRWTHTEILYSYAPAELTISDSNKRNPSLRQMRYHLVLNRLHQRKKSTKISSQLSCIGKKRRGRNDKHIVFTTTRSLTLNQILPTSPDVAS